MKQQLARAVALLAVITAVVVAAPTGVPGSPDGARAVVGDCTPGADWGTLRNDLAGQVVQLVNQHRASLGLAQLAVTTPLTNAAVWKSRHMAYYRYMQHADPAPPVARSVGDRLSACGYPATMAGWGENIAYGYPTADAVMQGWLNSPGHRANIERASCCFMVRFPLCLRARPTHRACRAPGARLLRPAGGGSRGSPGR